MRGSIRSVFGLVSSLFHVFATQPRVLSSVQLIVNKELFYQTSFYFINIVSSVQFLFKQRYLYFSGGGKCPGRNVLDPLAARVVHKCHIYPYMNLSTCMFFAYC